MRIGNREFDTKNQTYIMGILNVTPDSFSDGGKFNTVDAALYHTQQMVEEGADLIDVGGESTRPGYTLLSEDEEISRVTPVIERIKKEFDIPVSLDTYKAKVAQAGIDAGADLINDIWGLKYDKQMAPVIAKAAKPSILMHNRKEAIYHDFLEDVIADLEESLQIADRAGIARDTIIVDPGVGFAKTYEQNLMIMNYLEKLHIFSLPVLLAASRKSVIGLTLDVDKTQRCEGTIATSVLATMKGCSFVRVHDVKENARAVKMIRRIMAETGE